MLRTVVDGRRHQHPHRDHHQAQSHQMADLGIGLEIREPFIEDGDRLETKHRLKTRKNAARFFDNVAHFLAVFLLLRSLIVHGMTVTSNPAVFNRAHD